MFGRKKEKSPFQNKFKQLKKDLPHIKVTLVDGIPAWPDVGFVDLFIDEYNNQLLIMQKGLEREALLNLDQIYNIRFEREIEVREKVKEKRDLAGGAIASVIAGPVAGTIVGSRKKQKVKKTNIVHSTLNLDYYDLDGYPQELVFAPLLVGNDGALNSFHSKLRKATRIDEKIQENGSNIIL